MLDANGLMRQGPMTAEFYLAECVEILERKFGEGAAKRMPEVLAAMITASAQDVQGMALLRIAEALENRLGK